MRRWCQPRHPIWWTSARDFETISSDCCRALKMDPDFEALFLLLDEAADMSEHNPEEEEAEA